MAAPRKPLLGFYLSGLLMSLPAAILTSWGYHLRTDFSIVGNFFLAMTAGFLAAAPASRALLHRYGVQVALATGGAVSVLALLALVSIPSTAGDLVRQFGIALVGAAAGLLNTATLHAISPLFRQDSAATVNLAGTLFGLGCLTTALLIGATVDSSPSPVALLIMTAAAATLAFVFTRETRANGIRVSPRGPVPANFTSPSAVLFSLLLFFQFGNEWSIAGWLSIFIVHRLGASPTIGLRVLALYWLALLLGRVLAQWLLGTVRHSRLLPASAAAAVFGCAMLAFTDNLFGIVLGILLVGSAFASVYPLIVERIGARFPYYQPGLFNGIFSFALVGGMLAPWTLGYFANEFGVQIVMVLPVLGTFAVLMLLTVIWLESAFRNRAMER